MQPENEGIDRGGIGCCVAGICGGPWHSFGALLDVPCSG